MPKTKPEWVEFLKSHGEHVPPTWTITQMKAHWSEICENAKETEADRMKQELTALNKAANKKGVLQLHLQNMGLEVNPNKTIAQLVNQGTQKILSQYEPMGSEPVGFGTHGAKTFQELFDTNPQYIQWVLKTDQEDPEAGGFRLKRLARWARQHMCKGHRMETPKKPVTSPRSVSSFSLVEKQTEDAIKLQENVEAVEKLRKELEDRLAEVSRTAQELQNEKLEMEKDLNHKSRKEM